VGEQVAEDPKTIQYRLQSHHVTLTTALPYRAHIRNCNVCYDGIYLNEAMNNFQHWIYPSLGHPLPTVLRQEFRIPGLVSPKGHYLDRIFTNSGSERIGVEGDLAAGGRFPRS
jgi:hypothetical protein